MSKKFLSIVSFLFAGMFISSCGDNTEEVYNPFDEEKTGEFISTSVTIDKSTDNLTECEKWTDIVMDSANKVHQYKYSYQYNKADGDVKRENKTCKIYYSKDHTGKNIITTRTSLEYFQELKGIQKEYTQQLEEDITLDNNGRIVNITTKTFHYDKGATEPALRTSERSFTYYNDFCTSSTYSDETSQITYTYNWNAYQLTGITVLKNKHIDGVIEHDRYEYKYDNRLYPYSGTELMPFIQRGLPEIFASMGYFGKCTPYILLEEKHNGEIKYNSSNSTTTTTTTVNKYSFSDDINFEMRYSALSNIYKTLDIVFKK